MRSESYNISSYNISLSLVGLLALICVCCGKTDDASNPDLQAAFGEASQPEAITDSGKRLSGEFLFQVVADSYAPEGASGDQTRVFTFDEEGNFKVEKFAGPAVAVEEGSYLIDKRGELILYFDKTGGALLESARQERYNIISRTELIIRLEQPTKEFVLRKR